MAMYFSSISEAEERLKFKLVECDVDPAVEVYNKPRVRISVEGYDTSLPEDDINKALVKLFEKALQLEGSDVGGWNVAVKVTPEEDEETDRYRHALLEQVRYDEKYKFGVAVYGYDTSLPDDDVKSALVKGFSSCGDITCVLLGREDNKALVYFTQEDAEGKALKLNGSEVGGRKVSVFLAATVRSCRSSSTTASGSGRMFNYCVPAHCIMLAKENNKKIMAFKKERGMV
ncbi:unnamed protein product [Microthlaspi erraticum]|uniref:RRM domain-containing protein n=1 Tax=Microthlaspi erraticum TaxID=1685480 RepID=A0A6D2IVR2_9BRAS|nr:unnamed protein product [Microthlaspi erraticum]